jgi:formate dehydrogenase major subunit
LIFTLIFSHCEWYFEAALRVIKDSNPFPLVCGRVCPHPCEKKCRRNLIDSPVAINNVKRFIADWDISRNQQWIPRKNPPTGKKIAIVGAGPSGLSLPITAQFKVMM